MKEKSGRIFGILICLLLEICISVFLANILHQYMFMLFNIGKIGLRSPNFSYTYAVQSIFQNKGTQLWFVVIQVILGLLVLYAFLSPKSKLDSISEFKVTDKIKIPVRVGNGQYGNAWFLEEWRKKELLHDFCFTGKTGKESFCHKPGLVVEMVKQGKTEHIRCLKEDVHSLIIGSTGSGKTRRLLLETICMQIISGISVVVSDVKGELFYYTSDFATREGYKVIVLDFRNPRKSDNYNFLQPVIDAVEEGDIPKAVDYTWDLVSTLVGEQKGEAIWYNGETATLAAAILAVCMEAPKECRNMANVYYFIAYMCKVDERSTDILLNDYLNSLDDKHPAKAVFAMAQIAASKTRASFFTSAMGTLRLFTNPNIAGMTSCSDFRLEDISSERTILYMIVPDDKKTLYPLVSILINQIYIAQVELANKNGGRIPVDTDFDLDEIGNFPFVPVLENIASAGRSRGVRLNLIIQDFQQLKSKYKESFETIKTCCRLQMYLKSNSNATKKEISESLGTYTVEAKSSSANSGIHATNTSVGASSSMTGRSLLMQEEVGRIDYPYALCMITGESCAIVRLPDLSHYYFNKLLELGDENHNLKVIKEKEEAREEKENKELILWGIWEMLKEKNAEKEAQRISFLD